jgi:hypothetical protein
MASVCNEGNAVNFEEVTPPSGSVKANETIALGSSRFSSPH